LPRLGLPLLPVILFLLLASFNLDRPGLHYDEALEGGLPAVQLLNRQPGAVLNNVALHLRGRTLPLMVQNHIGALQVYAALPFIRLGGPTATSLRAMTVVTGAVTILAVYLFVVQIYGQMAAFWSSMWLAAFASFVFWSRQGVFVTSLAPCFAMCAFAAGARWWRTRRLWALGLAGLCAGLAIYSKLSALWLVNGAIVWWLLSTGSTTLRRARSNTRAAAHALVWQGKPRAVAWGLPAVRWPALVVALCGLLLGLWPLILYNLLSGGATFKTIGGSATQTYLGQNNTQVLRNLGTRIGQAADVLRSGDHLWYLGGTYRNNAALASVLVALLILVASCLALKGKDWRVTLFAPFLALMVILQSCFTISALWHTHFAIATPLPAIIFGIGVSYAAAWFAGAGRRFKRLAPALVSLLAAAVVLSQTLTSVSYLRAVTKSGGLSFHSASIYDLSHFLQTRPEHVVALDWGIAAPVGYLTGGQKQVEELFNYQPDQPGFGETLRKRFGSEELYITHATNQEAFPYREQFLKDVAASGMWAERVDTFMGANGGAEIEVWRVRQP
jgi:4-amino-4-deoxy-L-arabinose transferase-like glycosyltransferase